MNQVVSTQNLLGRSIHRVRTNLRNRRRQHEYTRWLQAGRPLPPPHMAKQAVLKEYAELYGTRILVETGTFMGDMVEAMRESFDTIYSIELSTTYFENAQKRFRDYPNIHLQHGDSGVVLGEILPQIQQPTLLWLDGHYSAGGTARGEKDTPVIEELCHVVRAVANTPGHVVLIDDARCFGSDPAYPSLTVIERFLEKHLARFDLAVEDDIIRITSLQPKNNF